MKMVCLRYLYDKSLAEEVMNRGFLKVFTKLSDFNNAGSFEGWMRRIMVNECLDENRRYKHIEKLNEQDLKQGLWQGALADENSNVNYLLKVIESLPPGYRTVFNMVEIDGFNHKEVAQKLNIKESASRSQLAKAKKLLRQKLEDIKA